MADELPPYKSSLDDVTEPAINVGPQTQSSDPQPFIDACNAEIAKLHASAAIEAKIKGAVTKILPLLGTVFPPAAAFVPVVADIVTGL